MHRVIVSAVAGSPGVFAGCLEGGCASADGVLERSSQPLVAAARELLGRGKAAAGHLRRRVQIHAR